MIFISFGAFLLLLVLGLDIGLAMITGALIGMFMSETVKPVVSAMTLVSSIDSAALVTVPLFVLAADIMSRGGILHRLVDWSSAMIGHFRGSLSQVAIVTNLIMAGISGTAAGDAAATGGLLIPAMKEEGYKRGYASAVIAAGAMLGPIIPPSVPLIVYAVLSNLSIARLFTASIVPGFILAGGYMVICATIARRRNYRARPRTNWRGRAKATQHAFWALMMPICIIFGVRSGLFTDSEAAAVICIYALIVCLVIYGDMKLREIPEVLYKAGRTSAVILYLLAASGPFMWLMNETRVAEAVTQGITAISTDPTIVLLIIAAILFVVGMVMEPLPAMVMFVPTLLPIQNQLGIDPIHFAMVVSLTLMLGMMTPPVGMVLFVVSAVGKEPIAEVITESIPFIIWLSLLIVLIIFFPIIVTWLPSVSF